MSEATSLDAKGSERRQEVAFIAGGAEGVGLECARLLSSRGAAVALFDRSAEMLRGVAGELHSAGITALTISGAIDVPEDVERAMQSVAESFGRITTIVTCNAFDVPGTVDAIDLRLWNDCLRNGLSGVFNVAHSGIRFLLDGGGSFVAVAAAAGTSGLKGHPAFCASMHGIVGLIRSMALEYSRRNVRCNVVCPALIENGSAAQYAASADNDVCSLYREKTPMGRAASLVEIAGLVSFLTSPEATYVNGGVHPIDGGLSAGLRRQSA